MENNLVQQLLKQVSELSDDDRFSFLMKLPTEVSQDELDKDTPSSMSRRTKAAVSWLQCYYEEDDGTSVHKQDIYDLYKDDCATTGQLPISGTNFGKIIKIVFPSIYNRRLGQRGQSKHCYWGLKRKDNSKEVSIYEAFHCFTEVQSAQRSKESCDMYQLSCQLVCEWASQLLDKPFSDIKSLSEYLISIGLSCGKTAAMFTMMSGSTSPPKLSTDKKTLSTRLVQRRLQHNEIIRKHKDIIKQQLKLKREQQTTMLHQKKIPVTLEQMSGQSTLFYSAGTTTMPRPLSVQPYMSNTAFCKDSRNASAFCVSTSSDKIPSSEYNAQNIYPKVHFVQSPAEAKRCQSTSLVEKHLVSPYKLGEPLADEHTIKSSPASTGGKDDFWSHSQIQDQPCKQTLLFSTSEATSRSPSISPIATTVVGCSVRNISRLLESPAPHQVTVMHQNKRIGDDIGHEVEAFIKKRCTTSIGVEKEDSMESNREDDFTLIRPYSCPISLHDSSRSDKSKKKGVNLTKTSLDLKNTEPDETDKGDLKAKADQQSTQSGNSPKEAISYHFVQKPQVISRPETSILSSPTNGLNNSQAQKGPTGNAKYNILNSLLSSDCDMKLGDNQLVQPMPQTQSLTKRDQVPHLRRISCSSHNNDASGFRSAFVPVTSQKQLINSSTLSESSQMNLGSEKECSRTNEKPGQDEQPGASDKNNKLVESVDKNEGSVNSRSKWKEKGFFSHFSSTTSSSSSSSTLCQSGDSVVSVVDSAFATPTPTTGNQKMATASAPATLSKVSSLSVAPAWLTSTGHLANRSCDSFTAGSPNLAPKKTKNRFTPIRPKLDGCLNVSPQKLRASSTSSSPQKRDMRPVHAILQEHRVKNAQDLLANLAHNYQAELGLQTSCNVSPASLIVSFETSVSESPKKTAPPGASMNVVSSLPVQNLSLKEALQTLPSTEGSIYQPQASPALSVSSLLGDSQMVVFPSSPQKQAASELRPILLQDTKGNQYSVDKQPSGTLLLQQGLFHPNQNQEGSKQNLLGLNSNQAHVIGPDAQGQTYLLVPNSDQTLTQVRSKSCIPVTSVEATTPTIHSSTSLTSFLPSKVKNLLNVGETKTTNNVQALSQHRTAPSAFHKCSPVGSTSKLTFDKTPEICMGGSIGKEKQNKQLVSDDLPASREELTMDVASSNPNANSNITLMDESKMATNKPSSTLLKGILDCPPEIVSKSAGCSLDSIQDNSVVDKTSVALARKIKNDSSVTSKGQDLINLQSFNEAANTIAYEMPHQILRKRKAATGDSSEHEGKKRTEEGENMENVEPPDKAESLETEDVAMEKQVPSALIEESESSLSIKPMKTFPLSNTSVNQSDTETLLNMMGDTRSMTVKEVVKALNKLRTKMKANPGRDCKHLPASEVSQCIEDLHSAKEALRPEMENYGNRSKVFKSETSSSAPSKSFSLVQDLLDPAGMSGTVALYSQRPNRRNISLNLESLEIDALLDLEPSLDCQLVGDIKEQDVLKLGQQVGRRASVGTVPVETTAHESTKCKRNRSKSVKRTDSLCSPTEPYKDKRPASTCSTDYEEKHKASILETTHPHQTNVRVTEKSKSCVQDILERGVTFRRDDVAQHFSSVVGLSSKSCNPENRNSSFGCNKDMTLCESVSQFQHKEEAKSETKQKKAPAQTVERTKTDLEGESDLPLDVIDFITEAMCDDTSYHSQLSQNPISSWLADFEGSTPGTEPVREMNCDKSSTSASPLSAKSSPSQVDRKLIRVSEKDKNVLLLDVKNGNQTFSHEENGSDQPIGTISAAGTFLSPTGPARSTRRPSVERLVPGDKNISRISNELPRPPSRLKTRAETPIESFSSTTSDIVIGKPAVLKRDPFIVRDHTTAVMLQQSVTSRVPSQTSTELIPDTCISSFVRQGSAELCRADRALSETPVSDPGYSSVGQTPVSEVGGSSVSPSPVMMTSDLTFRPVKSDSEANQINLDSFSHSSDSTVDSNRCLTYQVLAPTVADQRVDIQVSSESNQFSTSATENNLVLEAGLISNSHNENSTGISNLHDTLCALSELDHLMSVRLQCIPTPPSSPSGSPLPPKKTSNSCLPYVSLAHQKQTDKENSSSPFIAPACPLNPFPSSTAASAMCRLNVTTNCSGLMANPELVSSAIIPRFSPSPHLSMRPSCSPYQHYSQPSPPFTPSSQRCPTPSSLAIMSPRSNTPATESTATPNRFMPIQTSGILATSVTVTQTYIQPIKPVVTLASVASQKNICSRDPVLPDYLSTSTQSINSLPPKVNTQQLTTNSSRDLAKTKLVVPSKSNPPATRKHCLKKPPQIFSKKPISWTSSSNLQDCQRPSKRNGNSSGEKTGQPALVLSLGGNIGSVSLAGQGIAFFDPNQQCANQSGVLPSYREAVSNKAGSESHDLPHYHGTQGRQGRDQANSLPPAVPNGSSAEPKVTSQFANYDMQLATQMPLQQNFVDNSGLNSDDHNTSETQQVFQQCIRTDIQDVFSSRNEWAKGETTEGGAQMYTSTFSMSHTPDDLEETLDVLKTLDSQYFEQEEDHSSSTSL